MIDLFIQMNLLLYSTSELYICEGNFRIIIFQPLIYHVYSILQVTLQNSIIYTFYLSMKTMKFNFGGLP